MVSTLSNTTTICNEKKCCAEDLAPVLVKESHSRGDTLVDRRVSEAQRKTKNAPCRRQQSRAGQTIQDRYESHKSPNYDMTKLLEPFARQNKNSRLLCVF
jgi:hypothetical protein